jgi:protein phosphatase
MADTDVIGIVSLLLAAGGAAYLFRARVMSKRADAGEEDVRKALESAARDQTTLPPTLRPASERPPKAEKIERMTLPQTPEAKAEANEAQEKREKLKEMTATQVSRPDPLAPPPEPKAESKPEPKPDSAKEEPAPPTQPEEPAKPAPSPAPVAVVAKPASSPKPAEAKPKSKVPEPKSKIELPKPPPKKPEPKPAPSSAAASAGKGFRKQTIVGMPEPANSPAAGPPKSPAVDKLPKIEIPHLEVEEDEDTQPTRVGRVDRNSIRPPVEKHVFDAGAETIDYRKSRPLELKVFALAKTDPGKRRKQNEDSYLVREQDGLFLVADGMGGHKGGETASQCAVDTIANAFEKREFAAEAHADLPKEASELARAIQMANASILAEAAKNPALKGMGTTLCAARFTDDHRRLFLGHVGDSRCYRIRNGSMVQMTKDHTMADYGIAGPEGSHLSRALGVWPTVPIDIIMATPELNDLYLICSDGLTKMLKDETIAAQLLHEEDLKSAVHRLVMFANAHGGKDNITIILLRVVEAGWKPPSESAT